MADEKKTQMGTTPGRTVRPTSQPLAAAVAAGTPAPIAASPSGATEILGESAPKTSYLPDTPDALLGATVADRYKIIRKLGEGGMGTVYLALHMVLEKQVALKVLHGEFARKPDLVERFMQEAKAASRIRHENVIDISDFGATPDGIVFFAMEQLHGHDLHDEISRAKLSGHLLPWSRTKKIFLQVCSALSAAHARGIVHRDLKPENIYLVEFLGDPDFVKLLDFGIAKLTDISDQGESARKLTKTGMLFGTPEYMSPEQARGEKVDHRVDIYAMGCILFQLITNQVPFQADNFMGVLSQHLTQEPPQISPAALDGIGAPREIAEIVDKALTKDPNDRWQTIDEMAAAIREASGDPAAADKSTKMRAASVPSPGETTRQRPATGAVTPIPSVAAGTSTARAHTPTGRVKTEWTGKLAVPEEPADVAARPTSKSKLPLIIGAVLVAGAAVAVAVVAVGRKPADVPVAAEPVAVTPPTPTPTPVPAPPPQPTPPPIPEQVTISVVTDPKGAQVIDGANPKTIWGTTPATFSIPGSMAPRRFRLALKGYGETTVELIPNRAGIEINQKLTKGAKPAAVVVAPTPPTNQPGADTTAVTKPETTAAAGSAMTTNPPSTPPQTGSATETKIEPKPETKPEIKVETPAVKVEVKPPVETGSAAAAGSAKKVPDCADADPGDPCLKTFPPKN